MSMMAMSFPYAALIVFQAPARSFAQQSFLVDHRRLAAGEDVQAA
jgi:hypothetical protein